MITDRGLAALRIAATVNHLHTPLVTRLWADGRLLVQVGDPCAAPGRIAEADATLSPEQEESRLDLTPCGFRASTAKAWAQHRAGRRLQLIDLDADPVVEVVATGGDRVWPSGIVRVSTDELVTYAFGTFLVPDRCRIHGKDLLADAPAPEGLLDLSLRRDSDTEVTIVSAEVDPATPEIEPEVLELLESLLARFAAVELLDDIRPEHSSS